MGSRWSVFSWLLVCSRIFIWSLVDCLWSVDGGFYGRCGRWSVSNVVSSWCFAFLLGCGRFLFSRMVGDRCFNQYMVGGWSVIGGFVLRQR